MELKRAVEVCLREKYTDFTGRASRSEMWYFVLAQFLVCLVLMILASVGAAIADAIGMIFTGLYIIAALAFIIPGLAVQIRRLHDTGKSGWYWFIAFVPFVGCLILLVFFVMPSDPNPNAFGNPES
jgi:uncharacterized membrane protein YhaH (DUF805 family)